jgi:hypothetical protein
MYLLFLDFVRIFSLQMYFTDAIIYFQI